MVTDDCITNHLPEFIQGISLSEYGMMKGTCDISTFIGLFHKKEKFMLVVCVGYDHPAFLGMTSIDRRYDVAFMVSPYPGRAGVSGKAYPSGSDMAGYHMAGYHMAGCEGYERDCPSLICSLDPGFTDVGPFVSVVSGRAGDPGREVCMRSHNIFFYTLFLPLIIFNTCTIIIFFYYLRDMSDLNEREFPLPAESLRIFPALPHMCFWV